MIQPNENCPWSVPVPLQSSDFVPLFPAHAECNMTVDPGRIGAYGYRREAYRTDQLLHADLQTMPYSHLAGRLGSGRSGFYRNWYLKGVGRTPLAANWNLRDFLHNTGHLAASSAIREYVSSVYLAEMGDSDSIVSCTGVLVAELKPELRDLHRILYPDISPETLPRVDRYLQALTVKEGGFARWSNFIWFLHHLTPGRIDEGATDLATFAEVLAGSLTQQKEPDPIHSEIQPETLAAMIAESVVRTRHNYRRWFNRGIWWGSFSNNLTSDGRFLDLETPVITGGPFFGTLSNMGLTDGARIESSLVGIELFNHLAGMKLVCTELVRVLSRLPRRFAALEREFAGELANEIRKKLLSRHSLIVNRGEAVDYVAEMMMERIDLSSPAARRRLRLILESEYDAYFGKDPTANQPLIEEETDLGYAELASIGPVHSEPPLHWRHRARRLDSELAIVPSDKEQRLGHGINQLISELDRTTTPDSLLEKLAQVRRRIRTLVSETD
ncbi:MAG TPA: hypothetical protein VJ302_32355 [Blastocatellia bacterium]|nr:hypothetical protein [Blastocatellia bacterium]